MTSIGIGNIGRISRKITETKGRGKLQRMSSTLKDTESRPHNYMYFGMAMNYYNIRFILMYHERL